MRSRVADGCKALLKRNHLRPPTIIDATTNSACEGGAAINKPSVAACDLSVRFTTLRFTTQSKRATANFKLGEGFTYQK
jgi:hypothetical protein